MSRFGESEPDFEFNGEIVGSSAKAIQFIADHWQEPQWLPRSQIDIFKEDEIDKDNRRAKIKVRAWLAKKNGWTEE